MPRRKTAKNKSEERNTSPAEIEESTEQPVVTSTETSRGPSTEPSTSSSRPRRNARKNTLYNNEDYELHSSGPFTSDGADRTARNTKAPILTRESSVPASSRKRQLSSERITTKLGKRHKSAPKTREMKNEPVAESGDEEPIPPVKPKDSKSSRLDDGPPVLGPSMPYEDEMEEGRDSEEDGDDDADLTPPDLERNPPSKKRGRPKRQEQPSDTKQAKQTRANQRMIRLAVSEATASRTTATTNQRNVKLFEDELETTPEGDTYATVLNGCLTELLRKERIIDLLTNPAEYGVIRDAGWFLSKPPRLPPLTAEKGCFAFYVDGSNCKNAKDLSNDDLRPWSSTSDASLPNSLNIKPNVRRHPVAKLSDGLKIVKHDTRLADYFLTEYSARLPREQRLRKKIFYLTRNNTIFGNVLILYDYVRAGSVPIPVSLPHGNDLLRNAAMEEIGHTIEYESPFELNAYEGPRGGYYMKLRSSKLGWAHNKKQLLDYLYNKPSVFQNLGPLNNRLPDLPPLIETVGVFAYFVATEHVLNQIHHAADGLSPWTTLPLGSDDQSPAPRVRSTRRALCQEQDGTLSLLRDPKHHSDVCLVETMSTLARCKRVRKRVFYIQQNNSLLVGNVCYIYEFLHNGPLPTLLPALDLKHYNGSTRYPVKKEVGDLEMMHGQEYDNAMGLIPVDDEDEMEAEINHHKEISLHQGNEPEEEHFDWPDMPPGGYDMEFTDDPIEKAENPEPYYEVARQLSTGHIYLTVRHKKVVTAMDHVLEWIANTNTVEERGILNDTKPVHPPLVSNARAYAFFVAGSAIFPHDINRDDFSPWSHNGNSLNPVCYRTKVRKIGVVNDPATSAFLIKDNDYKSCPFHLVYLYSINPKDPRLRKKIFYMMETQSKMVVSHALILYDYNTEGNIVKLNTPQFKMPSKKFASSSIQHDYLEEPTTLEESRTSPFRVPAETAVDGTLFLQVIDQDFWNDRNRHIQYLVNQPSLIEQLGCLNNKVPDLPPPCTEKGVFIFFINGDEVSYRSLTVDKLVPWSENINQFTGGVTKRPKSSKIPLGLNLQNQLRLLKSASGMPQEPCEYQLHIYTATLPRCTRLRKKVVYIQQEGRPCGNAMIMYSYTEAGEVPVPLEKFTVSAEDWFNNLDPTLQDDINQWLPTTSAENVSRMIQQNRGVRMDITMLATLKRNSRQDKPTYVGAWADTNEEGPSNSVKLEPMEEVVIEEQVPKAIMDHEMMVDGEIIIEPDDVIDAEYEIPMSSQVPSNRFLDKNLNTAGFVRGSQRYDALWRIAQKQFGCENLDQTFDDLFKLLYEKNANRLVQSINDAYNVDIMAVICEEDQVLVDDPVQYIQEQIPMGETDVLSVHHLQPHMIAGPSGHSQHVMLEHPELAELSNDELHVPEPRESNNRAKGEQGESVPSDPAIPQGLSTNAPEMGTDERIIR